MAQDSLNAEQVSADLKADFPIAVRAVSQSNPFDLMVVIRNVEQDGDGVRISFFPQVDKELTLRVSAIDKMAGGDWRLTTNKGLWAFWKPLNDDVAREFARSITEG